MYTNVSPMHTNVSPMYTKVFHQTKTALQYRWI